MSATYDALIEHLRQTAHLESIHRLLGWDQQTYMPEGAAEARAEQMALLAGLVHQRRTDPRVGEWLAELSDAELAADPHSEVSANLRWWQRDYDKLTRLPQSLVEALTKSTAVAQQIWVNARREDCFAKFLPQLEVIMGLLKEKADTLGHDGERYDALLDEYEPSAKTADVARALSTLAEQLKPLIEKTDAAAHVSDQLLRGRYPVDQQRAFNRLVAERLGFDFQRGRMDVAAHPFCEGVAPGDCRITTRYDERWFSSSFFGTLHETGHALYEQGLPERHFGEPIGEYISLGIHESQSRLWENMVARSRPFWEHFFPRAQEQFPQALGDTSVEAFYRAVNTVQPSLIRVEADEATYNLHIVIRFELERALMSDALVAADLPAAWNEKYRHYLGIDPPSDADGVLQDVHWSAGLVGYFPTYALGNLYAAQMFESITRDIPDLASQFARGSFDALLAWLRENVHRHGRRLAAAELIERISNRPLDARPLLTYLRTKLSEVYAW